MSEVRAKKALGQHFLVDLNIARKICDALSGGRVPGAGESVRGTAALPCDVLEVGCGMGVLTQFLLKRSDITTYGAEIDAESVEYLHAHFPEFAPRLIEGDFLKLNLRERFPEGLKIIGNFPNTDRRELRIILRRWPKEAFTTLMKRASSQPSRSTPLRRRRMTALLTLGGGLKTVSLTVNRYSMSYHACSSTLKIPYSFDPGGSAIRTATSF